MLSGTECEENSSSVDNSPGLRRENAPGFLPPERTGEGRPGRLQDGLQAASWRLSCEVFAVEFQQTVRALDHAEAVGNEAVLQLIAGHQIHQNVRVLSRAADELVIRLIAERCVRDEGAELTAAGVNRQEERGNILRLNACGQNTASYRAQSTYVECAFFFAGGGGLPRRPRPEPPVASTV